MVMIIMFINLIFIGSCMKMCRLLKEFFSLQLAMYFDFL